MPDLRCLREFSKVWRSCRGRGLPLEQNLNTWPPCSKLCFGPHPTPSSSSFHRLMPRKPHSPASARTELTSFLGLAVHVLCKGVEISACGRADYPARPRPSFFPGLASQSVDISQLYLVPSGAPSGKGTETRAHQRSGCMALTLGDGGLSPHPASSGFSPAPPRSAAPIHLQALLCPPARLCTRMALLLDRPLPSQFTRHLFCCRVWGSGPHIYRPPTHPQHTHACVGPL